MKVFVLLKVLRCRTFKIKLYLFRHLFSPWILESSDPCLLSLVSFFVKLYVVISTLWKLMKLSVKKKLSRVLS